MLFQLSPLVLQSLIFTVSFLALVSLISCTFVSLLSCHVRFVEKSNLALEHRNDTFKNTTAQTQARLLQLEQEKVELTTELSSVNANFASLQLTHGNLVRSEAELKQQLAAAASEVQQHASQWAQAAQSQKGTSPATTETFESHSDNGLVSSVLVFLVELLLQNLCD